MSNNKAMFAERDNDTESSRSCWNVFTVDFSSILDCFDWLWNGAEFLYTVDVVVAILSPTIRGLIFRRAVEKFTFQMRYQDCLLEILTIGYIFDGNEPPMGLKLGELKCGSFEAGQLSLSHCCTA
jgi:hypothetical protein